MSRFVVLINVEEQYGLYPAGADLPDGWTPTGFEGSEADCMSYVDAEWTDLRPRTLRSRTPREVS